MLILSVILAYIENIVYLSASQTYDRNLEMRYGFTQLYCKLSDSYDFSLASKLREINIVGDHSERSSQFG